jgi:hypothetical protein
MGQSRWRSLAPPLLVASTLIALGACTPQFDLNNSPPPCIKGYSPCPMTGICQPDDPNAVAVDLDTTGGTPLLVKLPLNCPSTLTVRQSSSVFLPTPGVRLEDITVATLPGERLTATPTTDGSGAVGVMLVAPPGTPPGDQLVPLYKQRFVTINTKVGDYAFQRTIFVVVSTINAGPGGDDSNAGLFTSPFATFRHAAEVAQAGDTIDLRNVSDTDAAPVTVRSGVTVRSVAVVPSNGMGAETTNVSVPVTLPMEIDLAGDADLEGISLTGSRLVIDVPGSHVILKNVTDDHGLTVSSKASVPPGSAGTNVEIISASSLQNWNASSQSPLLVQADGAVVSLDTQSIVLANGLGTMVDVIRFEGTSESLTIAGQVRIENQVGGPAIHLVGSTNLTVSGDAEIRFINPVLIDDPASTAVFDATVFNAAPLTFKGRDLQLLDDSQFSDSLVMFQGQTLTVSDTSFSGKGIAQSGPPTGGTNIVSSATFRTATFTNAPVTFLQGDLTIENQTTFDSSLLTFRGRTLSVADTVFQGDGIEQDAINSTSTLSGVTIENYSQFGYHLLMGKAAISESFFTHDPMVTPSLDGKTPPWALWVEAPDDSSVSSQGTLYDTKPFAPTPCTVYGPNALGGLYSITSQIAISFCQ